MTLAVNAWHEGLRRPIIAVFERAFLASVISLG